MDRIDRMEQKRAYAAEEQTAYRFIQDYFEEKRSLPGKRINHEAGSAQLDKLKQIGIPEKGRSVEEVAAEMTQEVYRYHSNSNHPRFFGFVPGPASPVSWLGDVMTAAYNIQGGGSALAPAVACIERELIRWFCGQAGFGEEAGGLFVSGGSMANMTALIAARDRKLTEETMPLGVAYVSEQTHSSVAKGLRMIGIPASRIRRIPVDEGFRMRTDVLQEAIERDEAAGWVPFAAIATVGTTNTGSIDPIREISNLCRSHGMWLHIDGAYGGSVLLTDRYRWLREETALADSISWDAHKWLFQTYGCAMILVKDVMDLFDSFHVNPEYLKDLEMDRDQINPWDIGMELSRPARGLKLWMTMQTMGRKAMAEAVAKGFRLAEWAQDELEKKQDWEIVSPAQLAIVNFRFAPAGMDARALDELNLQISKKMNESGYAAVFTTRLNGKTVLRICAINPQAEEADMREVIRRLDEYAGLLAGRINSKNWNGTWERGKHAS